jgi:hypothetical protein
MPQQRRRQPIGVAVSEIVIADPEKLWPLIALRGVLAILFGIAALALIIHRVCRLRSRVSQVDLHLRF